jgi:DNA repair protein RadC
MDIPTFVKNEQGLYHVQGCVKPEEIVSTAATILLDELTGREALTSPTDVAQFLQMALAQEKNEVFAAIFLNNKHKVLSFESLFNGTIDGAAVYPRVVVQQALNCNAAAVIFAHNHPSECCEPSQADRTITTRLKDALALIDVRVLDHFVVSRSEWVSLAQRGWF